MTITTIVGRLADSLGFTRQIEYRQGRYGPEVDYVYGAAPAAEFRARQKPNLELLLDHDRRIGTVRHLERRHGDTLWCVAEVDAPAASIPAHAVFFSPSISATHAPGSSTATDIVLEEISLVADPATVGAPPVHELAGDLRQACHDAWRLRNPLVASLLEHARDNKSGTTLIFEEYPTSRPELGQRGRGTRDEVYVHGGGYVIGVH